MVKPHHDLYLILLNKEVLGHKKFKSTNPDYECVAPCVYLEMTGRDSDIRFDKHEAGIKANTYGKPSGQRLTPELISGLEKSKSYAGAEYMAVDASIKLRERSYAVW